MSLRTRTKRLSLWLRALWLWLAEPRHFWLTVLVVVLAILFVLWRRTEPAIRITGLILQVFGIGTVIWGIHKTRALFGRPSILALSRKWLRRFPVYGGRIVTGKSSITLPGLTWHARGYVSANAGPDATIEARVEALEKNVKYINERIDHTQTEMDQKARTQAEALTQEKQTRDKEDQEIRAKLETTETGGLNISGMGASWLFVGVILSTAAPELAKWLN
jgi:hypothetical protein